MILRVRCEGCGNVQMLNARVAYRGVACGRCGATIQTSRRPEAARQSWKPVLVGVVVLLSTVVATWGLVTAFSRPAAIQATTADRASPREENRESLEARAFRIARRLADKIVDSHYGRGLDVKTELDGDPTRDPAGRWRIPARIEWTGWITGVGEAAREGVSRDYWASGTIYVQTNEADFVWHEVAVSSSYQTLRDFGWR